jgi:Uma2 family endonuclease
MSTSLKTDVLVPVGEFLAWQPDDGRRYELVDGQPIAMAPAGIVHGALQARLAALISSHLDRAHPGCSVVVTPGVSPHMLSAHNFRIPDLGVTCSPILPGQLTLPEPVLLIEILSPGNQARTWSNVWAYTSIASWREILVLHSSRMLAELLRHQPDGLAGGTGAGFGWPTSTGEHRFSVRNDRSLCAHRSRQLKIT